MTASGFRVRITSLVFAFKSASLVLNQDPTYIRKPKKSTFDQTIKFLHWLFWSFQIVSGRFRWFQVVLGHFQIVLGRFISFQIVLACSSLQYVPSVCTSIDNASRFPSFSYRTGSRHNYFHVTENDIHSITKILDPNKAHVCDNISIKIINICSQHLSYL